MRTIKRDYARVSLLPDAATVTQQLPEWFEHYNTVHPLSFVGRVHRLALNQEKVSEATTENVSSL